MGKNEWRTHYQWLIKIFGAKYIRYYPAIMIFSVLELIAGIAEKRGLY